MTANTPYLPSALAGLSDAFEGILPKRRPPELTLSMTNGLLNGVSARRTARALTFGSASDADVVLLEDGIANRHAVVRVARSPFGVRVDIEALEGDVIVDEGVLVRGETSGSLALPVRIAIAGLIIELERSKPPAVARRSWYGRRPTILTTVAVAAFFGFSYLSRLAALTSTAFELSMPDAANQGIADKMDRAAMAGLAGDKLTELGLEAYLTVSEDDAGALTVSGVMPATLAPSWQNFNTWYDTEPSNGGVLVRQVVTTWSLDDLPPVASVRLTEPRSVTLLGRSPVEIGKVIHDDWVVTDISATTLSLERRGERVEIALR